MNKIIYIIISLFCFAGAGCTHNNGDIGDWFGTWRLESITVDGHNDAGYGQNIIWKFQSNIISIVVVDDVEHTANCSYGTWSEWDGVLTLKFIYTDNNFPTPGTGHYAPPSAMHLPSGVSELAIEHLSASSISLRYAASDGSVIEYKLIKWG